MISKIKIRSKYVPDGMKVLYDDDDIIVVDKPAGMLTVNLLEDQDQSAQKLITEYIRKGNSRSNLKAFSVNRLDKNTSGIVIFAKTEKHADAIKLAWPTVKAVYWAVVTGRLKEKAGTVKTYLGEGPNHDIITVTDQKRGELAITEYKVLKEAAVNSLVELKTVTNIKDQMRLHMAGLGCPIKGDVRHGAEGNKTRLVMHLFSLTFKHPFTGEECTFETKPSLAFEKHFYGGEVRVDRRPNQGPRIPRPAGTSDVGRPGTKAADGSFLHPKARHVSGAEPKRSVAAPKRSDAAPKRFGDDKRRAKHA